MSYAGCFLFGAFVGLVPAVMIIGAANVDHFPWPIFAAILVGSGLLSCVLGATGILGGLLRLFGRDVDP